MDERLALTALTEIREVELEMAQRLDEARDRAETAVVRATANARQAVVEARQLGARRAEERRRQRLETAAVEADQIRIAGEASAANLLETLRPRLGGIVDEMVAVVVTASREGGP